MALSTSDLEEYLVRKTIDAGHINPTITDLARLRFLIDYTESVVEIYLEGKRDSETQEEYTELLALIELIKSEAL